MIFSLDLLQVVRSGRQLTVAGLLGEGIQVVVTVPTSELEGALDAEG